MSDDDAVEPTRKRRQPAGLARSQTPSAEQLAREKRVLELRQEHLTWQQIADHPDVGYKDRAAAHKAYVRAMARGFQPAAAEVRDLENSRLDRLGAILWEILLDNKHGLEVRLRTVDRILRVMERRAKLLGLDHEHGIAERTLQLEAERIRLVAVALGRAFDSAGLVGDVRQAATRVFLSELRAHTDESGNPVDEEGAVIVTALGGPPS